MTKVGSTPTVARPADVDCGSQLPCLPEKTGSVAKHVGCLSARTHVYEYGMIAEGTKAICKCHSSPNIEQCGEGVLPDKDCILMPMPLSDDLGRPDKPLRPKPWKVTQTSHSFRHRVRDPSRNCDHLAVPLDDPWILFQSQHHLISEKAPTFLIKRVEEVGFHLGYLDLDWTSRGTALAAKTSVEYREHIALQLFVCVMLPMGLVPVSQCVSAAFRGVTKVSRRLERWAQDIAALIAQALSIAVAFERKAERIVFLGIDAAKRRCLNAHEKPPISDELQPLKSVASR